MRTVLIWGAVFLFLVIAGYGIAFADCNRYNDSRVAYFDGDYACAYTGSGCTQCWDSGGGSCHTNGQSCTPFKKDPGPF